MSADDQQKDKLQFAAFLLDARDDAYTAALRMHPDNYGLALRISNYWPMDPIVLAERSRLMAERASADPTSVADYLDREARRIIEDSTRYAAKDRLAAMELLGKLRGVINAEPVDPTKKELPPAPTYKVVTE
ncbi:MAG: putative small terminase [Marmoricola sp.]|nr:putative small terminase [Marmoricola sp.]